MYPILWQGVRFNIKNNASNKTPSLTIAILILCSFNIWIISIVFTKIDVLNFNDFLGTTGKYPISFWLSIVVIIAAIVIALEVCENKLLLLGAGTLILILFITNTLIEPNSRHGVSYIVGGMSDAIVNGTYKTLDYKIPALCIPYQYYQGFPIFIVIIRDVLNIDLNNIIKFFPSLSVLPITGLLFGLYKRTLSDSYTAYLASIFFITCNVWYVYMTPEYLTFIYTPAFLLLLAISNKKKGVAISIGIIIIVTSAIITHLIAPVFIACVYLGLVGLSKLEVRIKYMIMALFVGTLFISWLIYSASIFFDTAIPFVVSAFENIDRLYSSVTRDSIKYVYSYERKIVILSTLLPFLICIIIAGFTATVLLIKNKYHNYTIALSILIAWGIISLIPYGVDINVLRTAYFAVIITPLFCTIFLKKYSKIAYLLLIMFALIHPIAYSGFSSSQIIPDSEFKGVKFFTGSTSKTENYFSTDSRFVYYIDPLRAFRQQTFYLGAPPSKEIDWNWNFKYILHGIRYQNGMYYWINRDPVSEAIEKAPDKINQFYNNGNYWLWQTLRK